MVERKARSEAIKAEALRLGFSNCGIARAEPLFQETPHLLQWLDKGFHADMKYMERNLEKRTDPQQLVENAKSVIVVLHNYFPEKVKFNSSYKVAKYAYGKDYHQVLKEKLFTLFNFIHSEITPITGRCFTDSAPVLERAWAVKAGLGWIGKNSNLLTRNDGSFVFIGELIIDLELEYDRPTMHDYCGSCTICIEQCPTGAIVSPKVIDSRRCISYLTIENKEVIPEEFTGKTNNWIFGCDICQDVCPWNRKCQPHSESQFTPSDSLVELTDERWENLTENDFTTLFSQSPISRPGYEGLIRNVRNSSSRE